MLANKLPRDLLNSDGNSFVDDLPGLVKQLAVLSNEDRTRYRERNAATIAQHPATHLLVVAGPGTGKSFLFLSRIKYWLSLHEDTSIYVSSFVRKLVKDLEAELENKANLNAEDQARVSVTTLHTLARSLLERNGGTVAHPRTAYIKVISEEWSSVVWSDTLQFHSGISTSEYPLSRFENQFHNDELDATKQWPAIRSTYFNLIQYYNAVGFADMISLAREAVEENPDLNTHLLWIIDEYQDFNRAEDRLVRSITVTARGVLLAGDDEQALYQKLKASHPEIIISYYDDPNFANAMLPYCSRCSYYVCLAAAAFIAHKRSASAISKIYLPWKLDETAQKVQVIATATPTSAVDYIRKFIEDNRAALEAHRDRMQEGEETDPFLLILAPAKDLKFYKTGNAGDELRRLVETWSRLPGGRSPDYRRIATYCAAARDSTDNFPIRKVLHYEGVSVAEVHLLLKTVLDQNIPLSSVDSEIITASLAKAATVLRILMDGTLECESRITELAKLFPLNDAERLTRELEAYPLSIFGNPEDQEDELIQTAGSLAPVELMTIVGSKGLSAQHVMIIGCDDVNMKRISRLTFFVGLTRARKSLHLLMAGKAGGSKTLADFVLELPERCCEYQVYRKSKHVSERLGSRVELIQRIANWRYAATQGSNSSIKTRRNHDD